MLAKSALDRKLRVPGRVLEGRGGELVAPYQAELSCCRASFSFLWIMPRPLLPGRGGRPKHGYLEPSQAWQLLHSCGGFCGSLPWASVLKGTALQSKD